MTAQDLLIGVDQNIGVVNGADGFGDLFVDSHDHIGLGLTGPLAETVGGRAGNFDGVLHPFAEIFFPR